MLKQKALDQKCGIVTESTHPTVGYNFSIKVHKLRGGVEYCFKIISIVQFAVPFNVRTFSYNSCDSSVGREHYVQVIK